MTNINRHKQYIVMLIVCVLSIILLAPLAAYADTLTEGDYSYTTDSVTSTITQYNGTNTDITIPVTLGGKPVSTIDTHAFDSLNITSVIIPSNVKAINSYAFNNCYSLASVTLNTGLTTLGDGVFSSCGYLTSLNIPQGVTGIGNNEFEYCSRLASVTIPSSVTTIGNSAFEICPSLIAINIPSSVRSIGDSAFEYSCSLADININQGVAATTIGNNAFQDDCSILSIDIPSNVTTIGDGAFEFCESLETVHIASGVMHIGDGAFEYCSTISSITIDTGVIPLTLGNTVFGNCVSLTSMTIPSSIKTISDSTFKDCVSLASLDINPGITTIGDSAFEYCAALTSITIPSSVTTIGDYSFDGCTSATSVNIPAGVISIGNHAFEDCYTLTSISIPSSVTNIGGNAFILGDTYQPENPLTSVSIYNRNVAFGTDTTDGPAIIDSTTIMMGYDPSTTKDYADANNLQFEELPVPTNLQASNIGLTSATLTWDNFNNYTGYRVFKNGNFEGTTTSLSYTLSELAPGVSYNMTITAYDTDINTETDTSQVLVVTTSNSVGNISNGSSTSGKYSIIFTDGTNYYDTKTNKTKPLINDYNFAVAKNKTDFDTASGTPEWILLWQDR